MRSPPPVPPRWSAKAALAKSRANESDLRLKLDRQDPVGASARAAVAQSARKQAAKQAQTLSTQLTENVQEAEDETRREAEKRACAEKALATALAEKEAGAARAAEELAVRAASEAAVREELARSEDRVVRLEADLARVEAVVVAEKARADELEARNAGLVDQLNAAVEEIGRLQGGKGSGGLFCELLRRRVGGLSGSRGRRASFSTKLALRPFAPMLSLRGIDRKSTDSVVARCWLVNVFFRGQSTTTKPFRRAVSPTL